MEERGKRAGQTSLAPQLYVKEITPSEVRGTTNIFMFLSVYGDIDTMMKFPVISCHIMPCHTLEYLSLLQSLSSVTTIVIYWNETLLFYSSPFILLFT